MVWGSVKSFSGLFDSDSARLGAGFWRQYPEMGSCQQRTLETTQSEAGFETENDSTSSEESGAARWVHENRGEQASDDKGSTPDRTHNRSRSPRSVASGR